MSDVFNFYTIRPPEIKTTIELEKTVLKSHPLDNQSKWYLEAEKLKDKEKLKEFAYKYLKSKDAVLSFDDLEINKELLFFVLQNYKFGFLDEKKSTFLNLLSKSKNDKKVKEQWQKIADTFLSLSILKKNNKSELNYALLLKTLKIVNLDLKELKEFELIAMSKEIMTKTLAQPKIASINYEVMEQERGDDIFDYIETYEEFTNCECEYKKEETPKTCAQTLVYFADLMVLRDKLVGYEGADLAYIEAIMLGEKKKRVHTNLQRTETYSEIEESTKKTKEEDLKTNDRFSLKTETAKQIETDLSFDAGITANTYGPGYDVTANVSGSYQSSKLESKKVAKDKAVEITKRSISKIEENVREFSSKNKIIEIQEVNSHSFKNQTKDGGIKHINGMYQFIQAKYENQLINYGVRLMMDIVLPRPLLPYINIISQKREEHDLKEPPKPKIEVYQISDASDHSTYYRNLAQMYGVSKLPSPPEKAIYLSFAETIQRPHDISEVDRHVSKVIKIGTVPSGYKARDVYVGKLMPPSWLAVAGAIISSPYGLATISTGSGKDITGVFYSTNNRDASIAGYVTCDRLESTYVSWQLEVYEAIMNKYEAELQVYKANLASWKASQGQSIKFGKSTFENRMIEREQLKKQAISYITCQFYEKFNAMKERIGPCEIPRMDVSRAKEEAKFIQFFEQIIDWGQMTYIFYPSFWGGHCHEKESLNYNTGDPLHDKALSAGSARLQIPMKLGFENLILHYFAYGEIWEGTNERPTPQSDYYLSIAQELKEQTNFNQDQEGKLDVISDETIVTLTFSANDTVRYWDYLNNSLDSLEISNDIDREIMIQGVSYSIREISEDTTDLTHSTWKINLDRKYESDNQSYVQYSFGGIYVGGKFYTTIPQNLVYLRNSKDEEGNYVTSDCLPNFPQDKCE